jgi:MYXO-CTERM domain-containing protein
MFTNMKMWSALTTIGTMASVGGVAGMAHAAPIVRSAAGSDAAAIQSAVDQFRTDISAGGVNNGAGGGPFTTGRREINWDAAGLDAFQSPGVMPANFFNRSTQGSPRGAEFTSPGGGVIVSQRLTDPNDANLRFGNINPQYNSNFKAFSQQRLFAAQNSVFIDTTFFVPTSPSTPATVSGFGAVFTDVDLANISSIALYDLGGQLLQSVAVPTADNGLSFLGVSFDSGERIARVRLTLGNTAMSAGINDGVVGGVFQDIVAADDFFYSEPQAVPAPGALALGAAGALLLRRRRR